MNDQFANHSIGLNSPALHGAAITPDDDTDLGAVTRAIFVGEGGPLKVILAGDADAVTLTGASAGQVLPLRVRRVLATGTTASGLVGLW